MKVKYVIFAIILISMLIFSVSCARDQQNEGPAFEEGQYLEGLRGIDITLESPEEMKLTPGQSFSYLVNLKNLGRWPPRDLASYRPMKLIIYGYDPSYLEYEEEEKEIEGSDLPGKTRYGPGGEQLITFSGDVNEENVLELGTPRLKQDTIITACYDYATQASFPICIDRDGSGQKDGSGCPKEASVTLSAGQAAPVAVTKVDYRTDKISPDQVRVRFDIYFNQVDESQNLKIYDIQATSLRTGDDVDACDPDAPLERQNYGWIQFTEEGTVVAPTILATTDLECPLLKNTDNKFNIYRENPVLSCFATLDVGPDVLNTPLTIKTEYRVTQSIVQPILIENLGFG
ncbi:hypothetical protein KY326_01720 [Candidatus Woesearchaeota archaeon]|nr:hypothetical protein [Candidatus Woesearchaeota archaeon]